MAFTKTVLHWETSERTGGLASMVRKNVFWFAISVGILAVFLFLALQKGAFLPWFLFCVCLFCSLYLWLTQCFSLRSLQVTRELSRRRLFAGETLVVRLTLKRSRPWWPLFWIRVTDQLPPHHPFQVPHAQRVRVPLWQSSVEFTYEIRHLSRGSYVLPKVTVETGDVFGILSLKLEVPIVDTFLVYPEVIHVADGRASRVGRESPRLAVGLKALESTHAFGVREYVPGDRLGRIHWMASARTGSLKTKEFERHQAVEVMFLVDTSVDSYALDQRINGQFNLHFELAMCLVASCIKHAHAKRLRYGLMVHEEMLEQISMGDSETTFTRCMDRLATLESKSTYSFIQTITDLAQNPSSYSDFRVFSPVVTAKTLHALRGLRRRGNVEWWIPCGGKLAEVDQQVVMAAQKGGIPVHVMTDFTAFPTLEQLNQSTNDFVNLSTTPIHRGGI
jgi:uncharacterized protein (DUF58 family)